MFVCMSQRKRIFALIFALIFLCPFNLNLQIKKLLQQPKTTDKLNLSKIDKVA